MKNKLFKKAAKRTWIASLGLCIGLLFTYLQMTTPNPVTGQREIVLISQAKEIEIGDEVYLALQNESGGRYMQNPEASAYVERVGRKLAAVSDRPDLPFEFVILNNNTPNAWAAPGGKIAVNIGLLKMLDSEAELAAVLAHEITHTVARHTAQRIERDILLSHIHYIDISTNPFALVGTTLNVDFKDLKYTRDAEREADQYGMEYLARAGYDVKAAISVQKKLHERFSNHDHSFIDSLYDTHPSDEERIATAQERATHYPADGFDGTEEYQQIIKN